MKKPIYERIILEAEAEAKALKEETSIEAKRILEGGKTQIISQNTDELNKINFHHKNRVKNYKDRQEKGLATYEEQVRQELVVAVFSEVYEKLSALEGKELLNFVSHLLHKEAIKGDEVILVSHANYQKYLSAFSSTKDPLKLDLLNKNAPNYKFSLSKEPTHVSEGFLLSSKEFDLIFDFKEIVDEYQKKNEQRIYNELFKDE
jgi:vacuolar-type H+-ATPase subunit E/Vma4